MTTLGNAILMALLGGAFGIVVGGAIALASLEPWSWGFVAVCAGAGALWALVLSPVVRL